MKNERGIGLRWKMIDALKTTIFSAKCPCHVESFRIESRDTWRPTNRRFECINYIRMCRKIIDDYRLKYLNDFFEIKLIFMINSNVATF